MLEELNTYIVSGAGIEQFQTGVSFLELLHSSLIGFCPLAIIMKSGGH